MRSGRSGEEREKVEAVGERETSGSMVRPSGSEVRQGGGGVREEEIKINITYPKNSRAKRASLQNSPSFTTMNELFLVNFGLTGTDRIKFILMSRYLDRISDRLKLERECLLEKARVESIKIFSEVFSKPSRLFSMIERDTAWKGTAFPIPYSFGAAK